MRVILFQSRFAGQVKARTKRQTIRAKARCKAGDELSLRRWHGKPYRSKQEALGASEVCQSVHPVFIGMIYGRVDVRVDHEPVEDLETFAKADGFDSFRDMKLWFLFNHDLPFVGELIKW